jgi:hypothetical protein
MTKIHEAVPERDRNLIRALGIAQWTMTAVLLSGVVVLVLAAFGVVDAGNGPLPKSPETQRDNSLPVLEMITFFGFLLVLVVLHQLAGTKKTRLGEWLAGEDLKEDEEDLHVKLYGKERP